MNLSKKDKKYIWHPFTQMKNSDPSIIIGKGEGSILIDEKGTNILMLFPLGGLTFMAIATPILQKFCPNAKT